MGTDRPGKENSILVRFGAVLAELLILNLLTVVCMIPVITAGAAFTALHDGVISIVRNEEGYIARRFWTVFRDELKSSTLLWLPFLLIFLAVALDLLIRYLSPESMPVYIMVPAGIGGLLAFFVFLWVFPFHARFRGDFVMVMKTALILSAARFPRTLAMGLMWVLPVAGLKFLPTLPLAVVLGISLPACLCALFYTPVFNELESDGSEKDKEVP